MKIILLGAPGSGKGTQAEKLTHDFDLPQISTGNLLRQAIVDGSDIGKKAKAIMDAGDLVSDEIVLELIKESLSDNSSRYGFVLDGYPRNINQAESLKALLNIMDLQLDCTVLIDVDSEILIKRLSGRRICSKTGKTINIYFSKQSEIDECIEAGGELIQRTDDNLESITNRINVYKKQTEPLIDYYQSDGLLKVVDGNGGIEVVYTRLTQAIGLQT
ncbi:MAG TPA: adenylate kinase [Gammaproteobacteria bacterium]|jgi:adenylate kinase|nr:adenylate kinase [Gammaproteobacteria bacterium]HJP42808.1 adenylate kinase [Gammaproteobacteria bacterium]|tara:strand:+ start:2081 stop:2731 length:651 start_codon:yes stop_codon:yes gene_type:complete